MKLANLYEYCKAFLNLPFRAEIKNKVRDQVVKKGRQFLDYFFRANLQIIYGQLTQKNEYFLRSLQ